MLQDLYITSLGRSRTTRTDLKSYFEDQVFEQRKSVSNFGKYIHLKLSGHPQFPLSSLGDNTKKSSCECVYRKLAVQPDFLRCSW